MFIALSIANPTEVDVTPGIYLMQKEGNLCLNLCVVIRIFFILFFTCACISPFAGQAQVNIITTIANKDTSIGYGGDNGTAINAKLNRPESLCLDKFGHLFIADAGNSRIRRINLSTGIITTVAGCNDTGGYNGDGGLAINSRLNAPDGVFTDDTGNIYIADALNNRIRKVVISTGVITTIAGTGIAGDTGDNGLAINAELNFPSGVCLDHSGNVYIADYTNNKIRKIDVATDFITTIAGTGISGNFGDGGLATNAKFNGPIQVFVDSIGNIFVVDQWNSVVRKVDIATGIISTIAGNGIAGYSGDNGVAINAELNQPSGVYVDNKENIFITEFGNGVIRKINGLTGVITTIAGTGTWGYSGDGGIATNAQLVPGNAFFDSNGNMYIVDYGNNCIRKINNALEVPLDKFTMTEVAIYPNPTLGKFVIETDVNKNSVEVFDVVGKKVFESLMGV